MTLIATVSVMAVAGQPVVLYDSGATVPINPYVQPFEASPRAPTRPAGHPQRPPTLAVTLPIVTPELSPGEVVGRPIHLPQLPRPRFLVGADARSLAWLETHRERLRATNAVGLLVQARDESELRAVIAAAAGLPILPVSGSDIARHLGLTHYPVLIHSDRIEP